MGKVVITEVNNGQCATLTKAWKGMQDTWKIVCSETSLVAPWVIGFFASIVQIEGKVRECKEEKDKKQRAAELAAFPHEFKLISNWLSLHHRIAVEDMKGHDVSSYHREVVTLAYKYHLNGKSGHTLAVAKRASQPWGIQYRIKNKGNKDKYEIHEKKEGPVESHVGEIYALVKNGFEIAQCQKSDLLQEKIVISEKSKKECATMTKVKGLHNTWHISVPEDSQIAPWVIGFFASIVQVEDKLNEAKKEEKEKEEKEKEEKEKEEKEKEEREKEQSCVVEAA